METNKEAAPSQLKIGTASPLFNTLYGYYKLWQVKIQAVKATEKEEREIGIS